MIVYFNHEMGTGEEMDMKTMKGTLLLTGVLFLCMGIVFMGVSLGIFKSNERLMETGVSVQGVYSRTEGRNTWFQYEAEDRIWEKRSMISSPSMRVGGEVTVIYPAGHPEQGRLAAWESWGIFLIVGGVFGAAGIGFLISVLPGIFRKRSLQINGTPVTARVTEITVNRCVRINRVDPYIVHAVCTHPYTGQEMKVKSRMLMENPQKHIQNNEVEVLVDPMRENRYYMKIGE